MIFHKRGAVFSPAEGSMQVKSLAIFPDQCDKSFIIFSLYNSLVMYKVTQLFNTELAGLVVLLVKARTSKQASRSNPSLGREEIF